MMPTARRKLALFTGRGGDSSPRAGLVGPVLAPAPAPAAVPAAAPAPAVVDAVHNKLLPKLQPPLQVSRQQPDDQFHLQQQQTTSASRSIPFPKSGRYAAASMQTGKNAWDDSTVASLFSDNGSVKTAPSRQRGGGGHRENTHRREHSADVAYQRDQQHQQHQQQQQQHQYRPSQLNRAHPTQQLQPDENLPFVIGENGLLKVVTAPGAQHVHGVAAALNATISNNLMTEQAVNVDELYQDDRQAYGSPPSKFNSQLRRTKLPHRETAQLKRTSYSDAGGAGYTSDAHSIGMSPERTSEAGEEIEKVRQVERIRRDREREKSLEVQRQQLEREAHLERQRERERELQHKRSTVFENLTPVDLEDPTSFNDTRAAVAAPTSQYSEDDAKEALQRTPRANRQYQPPPVPPKPINLFTSEAPLVHMSSHHLNNEPNPLQPSLKRRHSASGLDYDDHELNKMSYSDLKDQEFDYDPQAAAAMAAQQQTTAGSAQGTLEERMQHYKTKGSMDQHEFFTRISASEWDQAGDWFLDQFSVVVQKMKEARRDKRKLVQAFEEEIAQREQAVRGKVETIEKTLVDLKNEGQTMMAGKEVELES